MRRIIYNIVFFLIALGVGIFFYKNIFHEELGLMLTVGGLLMVYGAAVATGEYGMRKLNGYEKRAIHHTIEERDRPRIFGYALLSLLPIYICIALAALIPITTYEVWFITVFPGIFLGLLPMKEICDKQYPLTHYRKSFWLIQAVICAAITICGQVIISFLL